MQLKKRLRLKAWEWYCRLEEKIHPLQYIFWETTLNCNLKCLHCGSECQPNFKTQDTELTKDEVISAFKTIAEDYDAKKITIAITGGEPLLRKDFFEITSALKDMGFAWGMVTNGTLITPEIVKKCYETGMETVAVSIDGMEETHDWLRGRGVYKKAVESVRLFKEANCFTTVQITSCITPRSLKELEQLYQLCLETNVDEWRVLTIAPMGRAINNKELLVNSNQLKELMEFLQECRKKNSNPNLKIFYAEEGFLGVKFEGEVRDLLYRCFAGVNIGSILYNGDISACPNLPRHLAQGSIRKERFSTVWENKYNVFRDRKWSKCGECAKCNWWNLCRGNSLHLWDWEKMEPRMCHYKMLIEH